MGRIRIMALDFSRGGNTRILWIPGRKKKNIKGNYNPTKQKNDQLYQNNHRHKKIEPWTLGGSHQQKIIDTDLLGDTGSTLATTTGLLAAGHLVAGTKDPQQELNHDAGTSGTNNILETIAASDAVELQQTNNASNNLENCSCEQRNDGTTQLNVVPTSNHFDILHESNEEEEDDEKIVNTSNETNRSTDYINNTATLAMGDRRRNGAIRKITDLDSIEHLASNHNEDQIDTAALSQFKTKTKKKKKSKKKKHSSNEDVREKRPDDDKLVTCLYYSLVCCDCTIS